MTHAIRSGTTYHEGDSAGIVSQDEYPRRFWIRTASDWSDTTGYDWVLQVLSAGDLIPTDPSIEGTRLYPAMHAGNDAKEIPLNTMMLAQWAGQDEDGNDLYVAAAVSMDNVPFLVDLVPNGTHSGAAADPHRYDVYVRSTGNTVLLLTNVVPFRPRLSVFASVIAHTGYAAWDTNAGAYRLLEAWEYWSIYD